MSTESSRHVIAFYNRWASDFDQPDFMTAREEDLFLQMCGHLSDRSVLEFGAGTGRITASLLKRGARVCATEPAGEMLAVLRENLAKAEESGALCSEQATWREARPMEGFDIVAAAMLIDHVDDPAEFFRKCKSFLHPAGRMILSGVNPSYELIVRNARVFRETRPSDGQTGESVRAHIHLFSELLVHARKAGLQLEDFREARIDRELIKAFPDLAGHENFPCVWAAALSPEPPVPDELPFAAD